tara:strand:- start:7407 stop:7796 length:390 start_codon:yes stop_codon:yes gene_type:complete
MQVLTFTFPGLINISVQIGDIAYYSPINSVGQFDTSNINNVIEMGEIIDIDRQANTLAVVFDDVAVVGPAGSPTGVLAPAAGDFIMFGKNKKVNTTSLVGYYAEAQFRNNSSEKIELYSVGSIVTESSK